jgi:hypothetical protein
MLMYISKAILVTGRGGSYGRETSRLTDGGEIFSFTRRPPFNPQQDSWYSVLLDIIARLEGLGKLKNPMASSGIEPAIRQSRRQLHLRYIPF